MKVNQLLLMDNPVQHYAWGSREAIATLLGQQIPSDLPQAELWMGAHPKAPSCVVFNGKRQPLDVLVAAHPQSILGESVSRRFNNRFPYLFKVLAVAEPLSIQAHPDKRQAEAGFLRENREGILPDAPERNYRDDNHKPECLCALTEFWGLKGFRTVPQIVRMLKPVMSGELKPIVLDLQREPDARGMRRFFRTLMTLDEGGRTRITARIVEKAREHEKQDPAYRWISTLHRTYSGDIGILSPLILNLVCLKPGEAMFLPAGELHAYLHGTGIELMANSDNVLRGGLTPKHVDVEELLKVLRFDPGEVEILQPTSVGSCERQYAVDVDEFMLSVITVDADHAYRSAEKRGPEILLCTEGEAQVQTNDQNIVLSKGRSVLVPARLSSYHIFGSAVFYKAGLPESIL